jgi:hypothetical protein
MILIFLKHFLNAMIRVIEYLIKISEFKQPTYSTHQKNSNEKPCLMISYTLESLMNLLY